MRRIQRTTKIDPEIYSQIEQLAKEEDRTINNMIERLIKEALNARQISES